MGGCSARYMRQWRQQLVAVPLTGAIRVTRVSALPLTGAIRVTRVSAVLVTGVNSVAARAMPHRRFGGLYKPRFCENLGGNVALHAMPV